MIILFLLMCGMLVVTTGEITAKSQLESVGQIQVGPTGGGGEGDTLWGGPGNPNTDTGEGDPDDLLNLNLPWLLLLSGWLF